MIRVFFIISCFIAAFLCFMTSHRRKGALMVNYKLDIYKGRAYNFL